MSGLSPTRPTRDRTTAGETSKPTEPPAGSEAAAEPADPKPEEPTANATAKGTRTQRPARELSDDVLFDALQNSRRREVIRYLRSLERPVDIGKLAERVAAHEYETTVEGVSSAQRKRVYVGLHQCHLPRLDDMGIVEFDRDQGRVSLGPAAPQLYEYMPTVDDDAARPWELYYLGYAVTSAVVVTASAAIGGFATGALGSGLAFAIVTALGILAVAHVLDTRR